MSFGKQKQEILEMIHNIRNETARMVDMAGLNEADIHDDDDAIIEIHCNAFCADELIPMLRTFQTMTSIGSSRTVKIEDWDGEGQQNTFGIDGDGPSNIKKITLNGKEIK